MELTCRIANQLRRCRPVLLGTFLLGGCSITPCDAADGGCPTVSGTYDFTLGAAVLCDAYQSGTPQGGQLVVSQTGSQLSFTLWPSGIQPQTLTGTLSSESSSAASFALTSTDPNAALTGNFSFREAAPTILGTLQLTLGGPNEHSDAGLDCDGSTSFQATQTP